MKMTARSGDEETMFHDEKIDYTNYLRDKPREKDPEKLAAMEAALRVALKGRGVRGRVTAVYYTDGCVKVSVNGKYYGMFDTNTGKFFSGYVGD